MPGKSKQPACMYCVRLLEVGNMVCIDYLPDEPMLTRAGSCRCASIDGDADRLVYFMQPGGKFVLLDGDRIAVLAALLVRDLLAQLLPQDPPITVRAAR